MKKMEDENYWAVIYFLTYGFPLTKEIESNFVAIFTEYATGYPGLVPESCGNFFGKVSTLTDMEKLKQFWSKLVIADYREKLGVKKEHCLIPGTLVHKPSRQISLFN